MRNLSGQEHQIIVPFSIREAAEVRHPRPAIERISKWVINPFLHLNPAAPGSSAWWSSAAKSQLVHHHASYPAHCSTSSPAAPVPPLRRFRFHLLLCLGKSIWPSAPDSPFPAPEELIERARSPGRQDQPRHLRNRRYAHASSRPALRPTACAFNSQPCPSTARVPGRSTPLLGGQVGCAIIASGGIPVPSAR